MNHSPLHVILRVYAIVLWVLFPEGYKYVG